MGLDSVQLVMDLEEAFGIEIPDEDAARLETPRMVLDYVAARLPPEAWPRERIEFRVREVVRDSTGVGDFELDDYFVRDMGID